MEERNEEKLDSHGTDGIADEVATETGAEPDHPEAPLAEADSGEKTGTNPTRIAVLLVIVLVALTFTVVKVVQNRNAANAGDFHPGDVLHFVENDAPFGTVLEVDEAHQFEVGPPTQAFLVRLAASDKEAWIGRDFAGKALYKATVAEVEIPMETDATAGEAAATAE